MFTWFTVATGVVIVGAAFSAYARSRDAFHPAVLMSPLFLYMYSVWPLVLNRNHELYQFFSPGQLEHVALVYLLSILCLYMGLVHRQRTEGSAGLTIDVFNIEIDETTRKQIMRLGLFLGFLAVLAYLYQIYSVGGFETAYGRAKGGGRAESGYIGESVLFSFPAVLLYAISRRTGRITLVDILIVFTMMAPHLLQGTLGGRRGPIFLALATLFVAWFIAKRRTPKMSTVLVGIGLCGLAVLFVWSQRQDVYLGSSGEIQAGRIWEKVLPEDTVNAGNTYVVGAATVLMSEKLDFHYWGYRYFVTFLIRPIPRQIWPTKYTDMEADWLLRHGEEARNQRYFNTVGFIPLAGSAYGYVADGFLEFSWGVLLLSYLLGRGFNAAWRRHVGQGQFWSVLYVVMIVLSIYLATQSLTAWAHRLLFIAGMTYVFWRYWIRGSGVAAKARAQG